MRCVKESGNHVLFLFLKMSDARMRVRGKSGLKNGTAVKDGDLGVTG